MYKGGGAEKIVDVINGRPLNASQAKSTQSANAIAIECVRCKQHQEDAHSLQLQLHQ